MNFRDQPLTCTMCRRTFVFTVTEQRKLYSLGEEIIPPERCSRCLFRDAETGRSTGEVKWFNFEKGYGFIVKPDNTELFFHRTQVVDQSTLRSLREGTPVTFEEVAAERGPEAHRVELDTL